MQLECSYCRKTLNLPDAKLPVGRAFSFTCPYCRQKNSAFLPAAEPALPAPADGAAPESSSPEPSPPEPSLPEPPAPEAASQPDRRQGDRRQSPRDRRQVSGDQPPRPAPENYLTSEENFQSSSSSDERLKGLVVYDDEQVSEMLIAALQTLGFEATAAVNLRDAAKHLKFASFNIVLIQENYYGASLAGNHLLRSIQNMDSHSRRGMLVVLISPTLATLDDLLAFSLSFDAVVNQADLDTIDRILKSVLARARKFYAVYREILTEHGFD